jgi:hypothetical protein
VLRDTDHTEAIAVVAGRRHAPNSAYLTACSGAMIPSAVGLKSIMSSEL